MEPTVIISAIVSVAATVLTFITARSARKKTEKEADSIVVGSAEKMVKIVMLQLDYMESQVSDLQSEIVRLRRQVADTVAREAMLLRQIDRLKAHILDAGLELPILP